VARFLAAIAVVLKRVSRAIPGRANWLCAADLVKSSRAYWLMDEARKAQGDPDQGAQ
jgi:hypothetical protein